MFSISKKDKLLCLISSKNHFDYFCSEYSYICNNIYFYYNNFCGFFFGKGNDNWLVFCFMIAIDLVCNPLFLSQSIYVFLTCCLYLRCMINLLKVLEHDIQTFEKKSIGTETKQPNNICQLWCWKSNINLSRQ